MSSGRSLPEILKGTRGRAAREAGRENRCARDVEASAQLDPTGYLPSEIKEAPTLRDQVSAFDRHHEHELKPGRAHSLAARSARSPYARDVTHAPCTTGRAGPHSRPASRQNRDAAADMVRPPICLGRRLAPQGQRRREPALRPAPELRVPHPELTARLTHAQPPSSRSTLISGFCFAYGRARSRSAGPTAGAAMKESSCRSRARDCFSRTGVVSGGRRTRARSWRSASRPRPC